MLVAVAEFEISEMGDVEMDDDIGEEGDGGVFGQERLLPLSPIDLRSGEENDGGVEDE